VSLSRGGRRITLILDPEVDLALAELVKRKGGRKHGVTATAEINRAITEYVARAATAGPLGPVEEALDRVLLERLTQLEVWLRPMLANTGINATASLLASIEGICGTHLPKEKVPEYVDLLRGRAWHLFRRPVQDAGSDKTVK